MPGFFITIEGIEGAGKSSIAERLDEWLQKKGLQTFRTREPGGTIVGEKLREIILNAERPLTVQAELLLIEAARAQLMEEVILPQLADDKSVILDRHCDSSTAYQGYGRGVDAQLISTINRFACQNRIPDLSILLDIDVMTGLSRARTVKEKEDFKDRFESEAVEFMQKVRDGFLEIARQEPNRVIKISAQTELDMVWSGVQNAVSDRLFSR